MIDLFLVFWCLLIVLSIGWYAFLLFYVGIKGGRDIARLTRALRGQPPSASPR